MGNSSMSLLGDSKVAEELELNEEQVDALDELQGDMRNVFRETFSGMRDRFREADVDREALMDEIRGAIQEKMKSVDCLLYTSPSPRDGLLSRMPSSA